MPRMGIITFVVYSYTLLFVFKAFKCQNLSMYVYSVFFNPISYTIMRKHCIHLLFLCKYTCKNYETTSKFFSAQ